ncbi:Uu.00g107420.m01.CDS01 [Anthostomella pinea]|uniref:Uu.00g107420.m01.CDS01 n=1 Tax=Anthostomella pinea TaxID=933095 RepID=A0AAI8VED1_9PEZI|nr:Uu.00g107420.m01.CDS01 [Anthostomella pinea]
MGMGMGVDCDTPSSAGPAANPALCSSSRKRKLPDTWTDAPRPSNRANTPNLDSIGATKQPDGGKPKKARKAQAEQEEKRLRRFRAKAPQTFNDVYERATSQRFYVLNRSRAGTAECPEELVEMTGSTGNIYAVHVAQQPTCTCPHSQNGHQCKHVLYVLSRVLHARFDLVYQLALLSTELQDIFRSAPPIEVGDDTSKKGADKNRKAVEGDCPICFTLFEAGEDIVYCRATCGQNIHQECFEMWAATKRKSARDQVTCPMCRTPWQGDDDMVKKIKKTGIPGPDGYVNVADQLGLSQKRDTSTYYSGPRRGQRYTGWW